MGILLVTSLVISKILLIDKTLSDAGNEAMSFLGTTAAEEEVIFSGVGRQPSKQYYISSEVGT